MGIGNKEKICLLDETDFNQVHPYRAFLAPDARTESDKLLATCPLYALLSPYTQKSMFLLAFNKRNR